MENYVPEIIGQMDWKAPKGRVFADLIKVTDSEMEYFKDIPLKPGEKLFRYSNATTKAGKIMPLVKINTEKKLVYFLKDNDYHKICFETRGIKLLLLHFMDVEIFK